MVVSLGPQGTLATGTKTQPVTAISETPSVYLRLLYLDEMRYVYFMRISAHLGFIMDIKQ
jgi:hypothetical protein